MSSTSTGRALIMHLCYFIILTFIVIQRSRSDASSSKFDNIISEFDPLGSMITRSHDIQKEKFGLYVCLSNLVYTGQKATMATTKYTCSRPMYYIFTLLLMSGDIEYNPGPCGYCHELIMAFESEIECTACSDVFRLICVNVDICSYS